MSNTFEVVFSGEVLDGFDDAETRAKIGKLFNADAAKLERLFSGNSIVIKKNLDETTAFKYVGAFKNAGAKAIARDAAATNSFDPTPTAADTPAPAAESKPAPTATPEKSTSSIFEHSGAASAHVTPAPKTQLELDSNPDLSALSLREPTGNLVDASGEVPEPEIDTSDFSLASTGEDLVQAKKEPKPFDPDLSGISLVDD